MLVSVLKLLLAPALIGLASWVARRWGPGVGGWFAALPLTSGPVAFILALDQGPAFAGRASAGVLLALISLVGFSLAYAWSARRFHWVGSSLLSCAIYLACTWALQGVTVPLGWVFVMGCAALLIATRILPAGDVVRQVAVAPWWDIPLRMGLAAAMVAGLTQAATALGPRMTGLLTPFPVVATILAAFTHHSEGAAAAGELLRGLLKGLLSFAVFFLIVGAGVTAWGVVPAFGAATLGALATQAAVLRWVQASSNRLSFRSAA